MAYNLNNYLDDSKEWIEAETKRRMEENGTSYDNSYLEAIILRSFMYKELQIKLKKIVEGLS